MAEKTVSRNCEHCGGSFQVIPSRLKHGRGRHCSPACQYAAIRARPKGVPFSCVACGTQFSLAPSTVRNHRGAGKYCSRVCRDKHWVGKNTPNWQNGSGVYKRGNRWYSTRRRILARDKVCQHCGAKDELHVHHNIPFRMFEDVASANADSNLVALCPPCHRKEESRYKWVSLPDSGCLRFFAGSPTWALARDRGLV